MGGDGVNSSNYASPAYDALFPRMKDLPNGAERAEAIRRARKLARKKMQREGLLPSKPKPEIGARR